MRRLLRRTFGALSYAAFVVVLTTFLAFVADVMLPRSVDRGPPTDVAAAVAIDLGLVLFFGAVHSLMARSWLKQRLGRVIAPALERSVYVLVASLQLALLMGQWRPIPAIVWHAQGPLAIALGIGGALGWAIMLASSYAIDHFGLFGLRQSFERPMPSDEFRIPRLYRLVRHPLYGGMLLGLWCAPTMTAGHALLAASLSVYVLVGAHHEERDLVRRFGETYRRYQREVPMLVPRPRALRLSDGTVRE